MNYNSSLINAMRATFGWLIVIAVIAVFALTS